MTFKKRRNFFFERTRGENSSKKEGGVRFFLCICLCVVFVVLKMASQHCIIYWYGVNERIEVFPHLKGVSVPSSSAVTGIDDIVKILNELSKSGWKIVTQTATRGKWMWTLARGLT